MGFLRRFGQPSVRATDAIELVAAGATLLDVRENSEWNAGHAPGAGQIAARASRRLPKGRQVIVVCRSGARGSTVARTLRSTGIDAVNLKGGLRAWESAGGRIVGKGSRPGVIA
jgi:rhodanese-related sulfurtransferase